MAYVKGSISTAVGVGVRHCLNTQYIRAVCRSTLDWSFRREMAPLKVVALSSVSPTRQDVRVPIDSSVWGETPLIDTIALCTLLKSTSCRRVFEFGTFTGNTTLAMAMNADGASLFTLDLPPQTRSGVEGLDWESNIDDQIIGQRFRNSPYADSITQLFSDSRTFDTSPYRRSMDFVWVDACHEYDFVRNDSTKGFEMLADDGIIAWHDLSRACPGVGRYLCELAREREVFWVHETQVAFCRGRK